MMPRWLDQAQRATLLLTVLLFSAGYATVGLALLLMTVIAEGVVRRRIPWHRSLLDIPIVLFVVAFMISGWLSQFRGVAIGSTGLAALTLYLGVSPLTGILTRDRGFVRPFLWAWLVGGVLAATWAIVVHYQTVRPAFLPSLGQNAVGTTSMIALIIGVGLFLTGTDAWWRYLVGVACLMLAWSLALTYTRGAWTGAAIGLLFFFTLTRLRYTSRALLLFAGIFILVVVLVGREGSNLLQRVLTITNPDVNRERIFLARTGVAMFEDHPVFGTGLNTFPLVRPRYMFPGDLYSETERPNAHNIFLNMAAEGGALGLAAFSAMVLVPLAAGWKWNRHTRSKFEKILSAIILSAFLAIDVHQLFDGTAFSVHIGSGMFFLAAILTTFRRSPSAMGLLPTV